MTLHYPCEVNPLGLPSLGGEPALRLPGFLICFCFKCPRHGFMKLLPREDGDAKPGRGVCSRHSFKRVLSAVLLKLLRARLPEALTEECNMLI